MFAARWTGSGQLKSVQRWAADTYFFFFFFFFFLSPLDLSPLSALVAFDAFAGLLFLGLSTSAGASVSTMTS